jgi:hypothetical protein
MAQRLLMRQLPMHTLNHEIRNSKSQIPPPAIPWLFVSDYKDIWFVPEKFANGVFAQFPQPCYFGDGVVLHRKLWGCRWVRFNSPTHFTELRIRFDELHPTILHFDAQAEIEILEQLWSI